MSGHWQDRALTEGTGGALKTMAGATAVAAYSSRTAAPADRSTRLSDLNDRAKALITRINILATQVENAADRALGVEPPPTNDGSGAALSGETESCGVVVAIEDNLARVARNLDRIEHAAERLSRLV